MCELLTNESEGNRIKSLEEDAGLSQADVTYRQTGGQKAYRRKRKIVDNKIVKKGTAEQASGLSDHFKGT